MKLMLILLLLVIAIEESVTQYGDHVYAPEHAHHPSYSFSYGVKDQHSGDVKSQWETRDNGVIKGHYSVVEPDGSIREVDYTADAKNGFNAVVKTHGPNSHPVKDEHGNNKYHKQYSQSKINHYSKHQDTLILSSDLPYNESPIAEINEKVRHNPSILEVKPNVELSAGHSSHYHTPSHDTIYQPQKFNPSSEIHHPQTHKYYSETKHEYKPTHKPVTIVKPVHHVKKVKLIATPGLKHFATHHKIIARNDYRNYFKKNHREEEEVESEEEEEFERPQLQQAPQRQQIYRRIPKHVYHRYAPNVQNYRAF